MIVVIAGRNDSSAKGLVAAWQAHDAVLLTAEDLSVRGWRLYSDVSRDQVAVASGRPVAQDDIRGVLMRLPAVSEWEVPHIRPEDRAYVAVEMTAFLLAWLSRLKCSVLNPPASGSLSGPFWRPEQWTRAAAQAGMSVRPLRRHVTLAAATSSEGSKDNATAVTILGDRQFGSVDTELAIQARRLADVAHVDLLTCRFSGPLAGADFLGVDLWPSLETDGLPDAMLDYFKDRATAGRTPSGGRCSDAGQE